MIRLWSAIWNSSNGKLRLLLDPTKAVTDLLLFPLDSYVPRL